MTDTVRYIDVRFREGGPSTIEVVFVEKESYITREFTMRIIEVQESNGLHRARVASNYLAAACEFFGVGVHKDASYEAWEDSVR
jgi:hypothetical protein